MPPTVCFISFFKGQAKSYLPEFSEFILRLTVGSLLLNKIMEHKDSVSGTSLEDQQDKSRVDLLTRYPVLYQSLTSDSRASTTTKALEMIERVLLLFGPLDVLVSNKRSAFNSAAMESHCELYRFYNAMVSCHPATTRQTAWPSASVGNLHNTMAHLTDYKLADWLAQVAIMQAGCPLLICPCTDTLISPGKMPTGDL